jgi:hypothetical protein
VVVFIILTVLVLRFLITPLLRSYAKSVGAAHFDTSAKSNKGLDEVFADLASSKKYCSILLMCLCVNHFIIFFAQGLSPKIKEREVHRVVGLARTSSSLLMMPLLLRVLLVVVASSIY